MSDDEQTSPNPVEKSILTEKEDAVLKAAWRCLKSAPDVRAAQSKQDLEFLLLVLTDLDLQIDMEKLMQEANFNTMKTASNNWAVIKKKLNIATVPKTGAFFPSYRRAVSETIDHVTDCAMSFKAPAETQSPPRLSPRRQPQRSSVPMAASVAIG